MTSPGPADSEIDSRLKGVNPNNGQFETYQATHARGRNLWGTADQNAPFQTDFGQGPVAVTIATYDQETTTNEVTAWRHIDPHGEVVNQMKVMMALWYWLKDGAPSNTGPYGNATNQLPVYKQLAQQLRNWPANYAGAMPGEPQSTYPAASGIPLAQLGNVNVSSEPLRDPRTHPPVTSVGWGPRHARGTGPMGDATRAWPDGTFYELRAGDEETFPLPEPPKAAPMTDRELLFHIAKRLTELGILQ